MEYQKRLRFIEYIKKNFNIISDEMIVFHYQNYEDLHLVTAQKITDQSTYPDYTILRKKQNLGQCLLLFCRKGGPFLDFSDEYLDYEEYVINENCICNSLNVPVERSKKEIEADLDGLFRQLNGEDPIYRKSDC
jgi:hypothetical protein